MPVFLIFFSSFMLVFGIGIFLFFMAQGIRNTPHGKLNLMEAILIRYMLKPQNRAEISPEKQRKYLRALTKKFKDKPIKLFQVKDATIPSSSGKIPVRVYYPTAKESLPALVYFHGGGWVIGDLDTHDATARQLAKGSNCIVVSVDYRLAPEHKFPAAMDDCYEATKWIAENGASWGIDTTRIAVGGDSAGGNLAAAVSLRARDVQGPTIQFQLLVYPAVDATRLDRDSHENFEKGYLLSLKDMVYFKEAYARSAADYQLPYMSPLLAESHTNLPSAFVLTAAFDPLKDEGKAYADALQAAGVEVAYKDYSGTIHAFFGVSRFKQGRKAMQDACLALRNAFERARVGV